MQNNNRPRVLIIDDEIDMRFYLMALVKSLDFEPILAKDGNQGLDELKKIKPSIIVLDIMMPQKGGSRVYQELVTHPDFKQIPIIFFSGVDKKAFLHHIKMLNVNLNQKIPDPQYFVAKNADPEYLKDIIKKCVQHNAL